MPGGVNYKKPKKSTGSKSSFKKVTVKTKSQVEAEKKALREKQKAIAKNKAVEKAKTAVKPVENKTVAEKRSIAQKRTPESVKRGVKESSAKKKDAYIGKGYYSKNKELLKPGIEKRKKELNKKRKDARKPKTGFKVTKTKINYDKK